MERHHHRIALGLIAALTAAAPSAGRAQDSSDRVAPADAEPADEATGDDAQTLFDAGVEHLRVRSFERAADAFRRSYRAEPRVATMCNLALTYDRWGEHQDLALRAYRTCARDDAGGRYRDYAQRRVGEIERELALAASESPDGGGAPPDGSETDAHDGPPPPPPPAEPDHAVLYVGLAVGGVALVSLGLAIGFAVESNAIIDALTDELGPMPTLVRGSPEHQRYEDAVLFADVSTAMYVLMGSLLAASGAMIIVDLAVAGAANEPSLALVARGAGVGLTGAF